MTYTVNNTIVITDSANVYSNTITSNTTTFSGNVNIGTSLVSANLVVGGQLNLYNEINLNIPTPTLPQMKPSLMLDFINNTTLDSRLNFSRNSSATRTNQNGLIEINTTNEPRFDFDPITFSNKGLLIEEQRTNLLTYTENFDNSSFWGTSNTYVIPNSAMAPDGSLSASSLVSTASNSSGFNTGFINYQSYSVTLSTNYTFSIYLKQGTSPTTMVDFYYAIPYKEVKSLITWSNPPTVSIATGNGGILIANTFTNVGGGWYRCSLTMQSDANTVSSWNNRVYTLDQSANNTIGNSVYIWGAQLEAGTFPTSYIPSTQSFTSRSSIGSYFGSSSNGLIQFASSNVARYNYNPNNLTIPPKLLLENSSTNILSYYTLNSTYPWGYNASPNDVTFAYNSTTAPDGSANATLVIPTSNSGLHQTYVAFSGSNSSIYTFSIFAKNGGYTYIAPYLNSVGFGNVVNGVYVNLANGSIYGTTGNVQNYSITTYPNGWFRISVSAVSSNSNGPWTCGVFVSGNQSPVTTLFSGNGTSGAYLWGAQVEKANGASSLIPSYGSSLTRAADISTSSQATRASEIVNISGTDFSSWFNSPTEWTMYLESNTLSPMNSCSAVLEPYATQIGLYSYPVIYSLRDAYSTVNVVGINYSSNTINKIAISYQKIPYTTMATVTALSNLMQPTSMQMPYLTYNSLYFGRASIGGAWILNGNLKKFYFYPKASSNTQLQALTS